LGKGGGLLRAVRHRPRSGTAEVYLHEMPGGQYTNLKEQAASMGLGQRWHEIARVYAGVNELSATLSKSLPAAKSSAT